MSDTNLTIPTAPAIPPVTPPAGDSKPAATPPQTPPVTPPERPAWLPAGFNKPEELAEKYNELVKAPKVEKVDLGAIQKEFAETGKVSEESFSKLEAIGVDRNTVERFMLGGEAVQQIRRSEVYEIGGGEKQYKAMTAWAKDVFTPEQAQAFNAVIESGDKAAIEMAVGNLRAKFTETFGDSPTLVDGKVTPGGPRPFMSKDEITKAFTDPRYGLINPALRDPAYVKEVEARLAIPE